MGIFWDAAPSFAYGLISAVAVLIIACPCVLGLANDVYYGGVGKGVLAGILIKNAEALEILAKVDTVVIDKTGTLTEGKIHLSQIFTLEKNKEETLYKVSSQFRSTQ